MTDKPNNDGNVLDIVTGLEHQTTASDVRYTGWAKTAEKIDTYLGENTPDEIRAALQKMGRAADFSATEFYEYQKHSHELMLRAIPFMDLDRGKDDD